MATSGYAIRRTAAIVLALLLEVAGFGGTAAQTGALQGRVRTPGGTAVAAAVVTVAGTGLSAQTDTAGGFRLNEVPMGRQQLEVRHHAYGVRSVGVEVVRGVTEIDIRVSEAAIRLEPLRVEALSADERRERGAGFRRSLVTRAQLERAENTNLKLPEALRLAVPTVLVRRTDRVLGSPVCVELRTQRDLNRGQCHSPAVFLDGVPISSPTSLYDNIDLGMIESMEVIPSNEAGVKYGPSALYGALLINTRRPGVLGEEETRRALAERQPNFDWKLDADGHPTARVLLLSTAGNVAGVLLGVAAARECLHLRQPSKDGLVSDCGAAASVGSGAAAIVLPALGSGLGASIGGRTQRSAGRLTPSGVGAAMAIVPGYALVFSGYRNDSQALKAFGYTTIILGPPLLSTAADYLFRRLRFAQSR